jgi:ADP-ribosylglycohydrolase
MEKLKPSETHIQYSGELVQLVKKHLNSGGDEREIAQALSIWTYTYPTQLRVYLESELHLIIPTRQTKTDQSDLQGLHFFRESLTQNGMTNVYLLNDAKIFFPDNRSPTLKIRFSRKDLASETDYLKLFQIVNRAALSTSNWESFVAKYGVELKELLENSEHLQNVFSAFAKAVKNIIGEEKKICFVDTGLQGTFALFLRECLYSIDPTITTDIRLFCVYPWLAQIFESRFFTTDAQALFQLERRVEQIQRKKDPSEKVSGGLVGFAIGDAMGFPAAGIQKEEFLRLNQGPILQFQENNTHPYFSHLKRANYTDNTRSLIDVSQDLIQDADYCVDSRVESLKRWAQASEDPALARWPGPTSLEAAKKLRQGVTPAESGSLTTESCSALYRIIPIALFFNDLSVAVKHAELETSLSHNSSLSKAGSVLVTALLHYLKKDENPLAAVEKSLNLTKKRYESKLLELAKLITNIEKVLRQEIAEEDAPEILGTGSPVWQTISLSIYYFLLQPSSLKKPLLLAANSYRLDTVAEKQRLQDYTWEEQLIHARGGNTDGIAGLTGALIGTYNGLRVIGDEYREVENFNLLCSLGDQLEIISSKAV